MKISSIRKLLAVLCMLLSIFGLASFARAADGDADFFAADPTVHVFSYSVRQSTPHDGAVYFLYTDYTEGVRRDLMLWAPGMEQPEVVLTLPVAVYGEYENPEDMPPEEAAAADAELHQLASGDGTLWGVNLERGTITKLVDGAFELLPVRLDLTGLLVQESGTSYMPSISCPFVQDGKLYLLPDYQGRLLTFDLTTGVQESIPMENAAVMTPYKPGQALVLETHYDASVGGLFAVNLSTGMKTKLPLSFIASYSTGGLGYNEATDTIYYLAESQLWRSVGGEAFEAAAFFPVSYLDRDDRGVALPGGLYAIAVDNHLAIRSAASSYQPGRTLHIQRSWSDDRTDAFLREHPETPVIQVDLFATGSAEIAQAIISGERDVDIYQLSTDSGLRTLIDKGYAADLSVSQAIADDVARMYPAARAALSGEDGKVYAYPTSASVISGFEIDLPLWESFGLGDPPRTWMELLDGIALWEREYAEQNEDVAYLMNLFTKEDLRRCVLERFIMEYESADQALDFQNPLLREVLDAIDALPLKAYDFSNMTGEEREAYDLLSQRRALLWPYGYVSMRDPDLGRQSDLWRPEGAPVRPVESLTVIPAPVFDSAHAAKITGTLYVMLVNPRSENKDLALTYIEYFMEHADPETNYLLHPDLSEPVRTPDFESYLLDMTEGLDYWAARLAEADESDRRFAQEMLDYCEIWLSNQDALQWLISTKGLEAYRAIADNLWFTGDSLYLSFEGEATLYEQIMEVLSRYNAGLLSLDTFLKELTNKSRMAFLEGQ